MAQKGPVESQGFDVGSLRWSGLKTEISLRRSLTHIGSGIGALGDALLRWRTTIPFNSILLTASG